jgi:MFS family permease
VLALSAIPGLLISPIAGWLVDRFGRRLVSITSDLLSAISVAAIPLAASAGVLTPGLLLALAILGATFDPAGYTARRTLIVDAARTSRVNTDSLNGIHEGLFAVGWTVGPFIGALLIATVGAENAFWIPAVLFVIAAIAVLVMRISPAPHDDLGEHETPGEGWRGFARGFTALWQDMVLRTMTIAVLIIAAIYLPTEAIVLPTYFEALGDPTSLGVVIAALAAGSAVGSFGYGWISKRVSRLALTRSILIGTAISILPMAFLPPLPILAAAGFALGLCWGPFNPLMNTLVQRRIPDNEQGRVFGVQLSAFYAAPLIAMVAGGWAVENFGVPTTYLALAIALTATSLAALLSPGLRDINR